MSNGRKTMPSKAFSNSELADAHGKLLAAKHERESDDELEDKIEETIRKLFDSFLYLKNITLFFIVKTIWIQTHRYTSPCSIKPPASGVPKADQGSPRASCRKTSE